MQIPTGRCCYGIKGKTDDRVPLLYAAAVQAPVRLAVFSCAGRVPENTPFCIKRINLLLLSFKQFQLADQLISFQDITIRVPNEGSFSNISFEIKKGEHWAFVGDNEVLKTALIDSLAGQATIVQGRADFPFFHRYKEAYPDEPLLSPHHFMAKIGERHPFRNLSNTREFYYQQRFNSMDSEDAITVQAYLAQHDNTAAAEVRALEDIITKLKLLPLLDKQLIKLSHGETKRLRIAAALLGQPEILLLTNPFTGLDSETRQELREIINGVAASGITVILSTHYQEIPEAITHLAWIDKDNTITSGLRANTRWKMESLQPETNIDKAEVEALLSLGNRPAFREMVVMKNVSIRYGEKRVLDNVNWTIQQGERWALLGPNGAGKSTLLSLINADNPQAFANHIILFDRKKGSGESIWDIKKKIGFFSPELYQYFPLEASCLEAVESGFYDTIGLFRPSNPDLAAIARRWMKVLGIEHLSHRLLSQVSGVNQRLCLLARAFVKSPPLLILDEPCQGFTELQVAAFKTLLNTICAASNATLLYVSHYPKEIPACVTKQFRLAEGKQVAISDGTEA